MFFLVPLHELICMIMESERILIVDDEETLCEVLKLNLENEGYDVDTAFSAEQALSYDLKRYSLILLDIMMGEISGIKMAKMMKAEATLLLLFRQWKACCWNRFWKL